MRAASKFSARDLYLLDHTYGRLIGDMVLHFCQREEIRPALIAWHGHTIFHDPNQGASLQIGHGAEVAAKLNIPTVCQFRQMDMALGGQGAPLAPLADEMLLPKADYYINLGGICNISFIEQGVRRSMDVCACNQILDRLVNQIGLPYDDKGKLAASGQLNQELFAHLEQWSYLQHPYPKSLDNTQVMSDLWPMVSKSGAGLEDMLHTFCRHVASQLSRVINNSRYPNSSSVKLAITGGGAFNEYLMNCIQLALADLDPVILPLSREVIAFKEAALIGLMGYLHMKKLPNVIGSSTGSYTDHIAGCLYPTWSTTHQYE
ncbi:MAG: anhydro-N-acetylmuramic acid kinase [Saprospiraceae bacterium]|nr:anhydro-N-acetylmuramic acid kinase [Saprospiraceae bacterium]